MSASPRPLCLQCLRPRAACWCAHVEPLRPRVRFVFLQHPREYRNPIGTVRMAHRGLAGSEVHVGVDFSRTLAALPPGEEAVVLYPAPHARDATALAGRAGQVTVLVIDGTWSQARKIWRSNPALHALPAYRLNPDAPGQYRIRREPEAHCLSTIEAVSQLLDVVAGHDGAHGQLLRPFFAMVEQQVAHAERGSPRRRRREPRRIRWLPEALAALPERVVLVHAEGNGWPAKQADRPPAELLHWLAYRPHSGAREAAFVAPSHGLSPSALRYQGLDGQALSLTAREAFVERFRAFVGREDVVLVWGHFALNLLRQAGAAPAAVVDFKAHLTNTLKARLGNLEDAAVFFKTPVEAPWPAPGALAAKAAVVEGASVVEGALIGRGARRLAAFAAIYAYARAEAQRAQEAAL